MDTLAHGLWGGAVFGQKEKKTWKWAFWLGMAPDLFSFGPFFLGRIGDLGERLVHRAGPPDPSTIPAYVYHAYNVTHSLVVWAVVFALLYAASEYRSRGAPGGVSPRPRGPVSPMRLLWPFCAWPLHILCDIPTHSTRFFPTPYLWPLATPFINGTPWGNKTFMLGNYAFLAITYVGILLYKKYWASRPKNI